MVLISSHFFKSLFSNSVISNSDFSHLSTSLFCQLKCILAFVVVYLKNLLLISENSTLTREAAVAELDRLQRRPKKPVVANTNTSAS